jgi:hypothetical protein
MLLVLCSDPMDIRKPDPAFASEIHAIERLQIPSHHP